MNDVEGSNNETGLEIAVIGMAGRFPGARNITDFWNNLKNGVESISFFTDEELLEAGIEPGLLKNPNYVKAKGVLEEMEYFDYSFFDYSPREAELMDPQFRVLHECAWHTLEDAGYDPGSYSGAIGTYVGTLANYPWVSGLLSRLTNQSDQMAIGSLNDRDFLSTRLAYKLNLKGPAVNVQSACSTSLVAIYLACQGLLNGDSDMALAGGASIWLPRKSGYLYEKGMVRSPDGRCRAFDAEAKGTNGGDGAALVLLKRLEDALADGDNIYAVVKGSAINNDGNRKVGYTAPSVLGQAEVIEAALQMAEVMPESITYVETHGTGTALGDPVEIEALKRVFGTEKRQFCGIGSVKSNFGHLDAAAGVAGFIKTVLALKHRLIPPSLHFKAPNPAIDFENSPFYVNTAAKEWKNNGYPLRAGVSSFGIGGTNVHIVLEEAPGKESSSQGRTWKLLLLSAKTQPALEEAAEKLAHHLKKNPGINLADAAYTLQVGRKTFEHRQMVVCSDVNSAVDNLSSTEPEIQQTFYAKEEEKSVIFMFPGGGVQYVGMGLDLYKTEPLFREEMNRCFEILEPLMGYDMKEILYPSEPGKQEDGRDIERIDIANMLIFIIEYSLARLLMKWGIEPMAMIGHSLGEYTAACLAGVFSLEEALELVALRGRLMQQVPGGTMLSVPLGREELARLLKNKKLSLAVSNSPSNCVVSGTREAIDSFANELKQKGIDTRLLHISVASHSYMMEPVLEEFETAINNMHLKLNRPCIPFISNVTGTWINEEEIANPGYWVTHLRSTVRFSDGLEELLKKEGAILVEVGPAHTLSTFARQYPQSPLALNLIRHPRENFPDDFYLLEKIGQLWLYGIRIDWAEFYSDEKRGRVPLPFYPFEKQRCPVEVAASPVEKETLPVVPGNKQADLADWFSIPSWTRRVLLPKDKGEMPEKSGWLVFLDRCGLAEMFVRQLKEKEQEVVTVVPGPDFKKTEGRVYSINPSQGNDYDILFDELGSLNMVPEKIVHFWGVTEEVPREPVEIDAGPAFERFDKAQDLGFYSLLYLAKAISKKEHKGTVEIIVVTDNMQHVAKEDVLYPEKAAVLGPIKVINQEQPGVICRSIDVTLPGHGVPGDHKKNLIRQLWAEFQVLPESLEPVAALRDNSRWVQTFEPVRLEEVHRDLLPLREKGVYLITGGMGELGLIFSRYLAEHYSARLILTGRSPFPAKCRWDQWLADHGEDDTTGKKIITLKEMEKCGAQVLVFQADAGDREQMQQVVRQAESNFGTVNGVIHAAGITGGETFRPVKDISRTQCQQQFRGKAYGLLILEDLLKDHQLDFCWVMSSISAVLGGLSHAAYAAANTFMDAYINARNRGNNRHWISVNWDRMTPHENVEGFKRTLALGGTSQVVASSQENLRDRINRWIKLESFRDKEDSKKDDLSTLTLKPRPHFLKSYVPPGSPVEETLVRVCTDMFGFEKIGIHDDFFELGGDSLKAVIFAGKIHKETHVEVPITEIFHCRTLKRVADYIEANRGSRRFSSIENAEEKDYYVLSSAQKRMYILYLQDHASIAYNTPDAMKIRGPLVIDRFEKTILTMIKRYESLRTSFELIEGEPVQRIHEFEDVEFEIEYHRVGESPDSPGEQGISIGVDRIIQDFIRPFDLAKAPPLRVGLIELPQQEYMVLFDMHHIVSDGISRNILERDFVNLYVGKEVPGLTIDYKDFSEWEERFFETPAFKRQEKFWQEYLKGELPALQMPLDFSRPETQTFEGKGVPFTIPGEIAEKLNILAKEVNVTLNILILSLYILLLHKYSGQEDIIVGSLVSGRNHADLENILGMFANFLPIRCRIEPDSSFPGFLNSAGKTILEAYENQDYPFEKTLELVNYPVDLTRNPMFDSMVIFHNQADGDSRLKIDNLEFIAYPLAKETSKLDFKIDVYPDIKGELNCILEYNTNLFKEDTIRDFIRHFHILISDVIENPPPRISHLDIFTREETSALSEKRSRSADSPRKPVRLVVSASFTSEPVKDYIVWWGKHFGLDIQVVFAPYNQVFQELLDEQSLVSTNGAGGINLLLIRFEDWIRDLHLSDREKCEKLESNFENLIKIFKNKQKTVPYFVGLFPPADYLSFSPVLMNDLEDMYGRWQTFLEIIDNAYAVDFSPLKELYSVEEVFDAVADREGHLPFSSEFYAAVGTTIARKIWALAENPFKVIVLDCDNTLWKGICGEDGPSGVSVDTPHLELQRFMARKTNEGFLLALCSKNNEADVWEVFENNPGMLLEKEHFVGWKIDWQPKSGNIKALARELNLGIDSFIFLDDSPMECAEVMSHCPEVLTLQLPENPAGIPLFLDHVWAFDKIKVTEEDRRRTKMYQAEKERKESEKESLSLEDFLAHLQLKISMNLMEPTQVSRVSQLTRRTNQFNLSTIRRTEDEIMNLLKEPGTQCWVIEVSDRFGDYGLVGVIITKERKESLFIDTLLLSCRVLGRGVEEAILAGLRKYCRTRRLNMLEADYFPTAKNKPLLAFLQDRWTQQQDRGEYSTYIYPFENRSESIEFVDFYYRETFKKELPREMETVETEDILPDHIAVAVTDMEKAVSFYRTLGYACGEVTYDPLQRSDLVICRKPGYDSIELVAATDSQSPTHQVINKNGDTPYHLCYRAKDAAGLLELFRQKEIEFEIVDDLKPAVLFDHKKVMFLQVKHVGLVELLEDKEGDYNGNGREGDKNSTVRIVVGRPGPSLAFYKLLGYVPVKNINTPGKLEITLVKTGAGKIELVVPKEETLEEYLFLSKNGSHPYQLCFEYDDPPLENPVEYKYICYRKKAEQAPVSREYRAFKTGHADNIDKLLHKKQLLPLENVTAERLLGLPTYNVDEKIVTRAKYEPPRNKWERQLVEIFKEVLKVNKVSIHDNYFDIGAHSWDIIKINSRLQKTFEKEITVAEMFRYPTISSLAVYFRDGETRGFPSDEKIDESVSIMEEAADTLFKDEIE